MSEIRALALQELADELDGRADLLTALRQSPETVAAYREAADTLRALAAWPADTVTDARLAQ